MMSLHERKRQIVESIAVVRGMPFGELLPALSDADGVTDKALGHRVLAQYLGSIAGEPEGTPVLRTLPVSPSGRVREPTKLRPLDFGAVLRTPFSTSTVAGMLRAILFVPILKPDTKRPAGWSFELPFLWSPSSSEWNQLAIDYEGIRAIILRGDGDSLSSSTDAGYGTIMMPKTSGRSGKDLDTYKIGTRTLAARKRAFFLRQSHTAGLLLGHRYPEIRHASGDLGGNERPGDGLNHLLEQLMQIFNRDSHD
jgi:DNA mismatch repair protein MutH